MSEQIKVGSRVQFTGPVYGGGSLFVDSSSIGQRGVVTERAGYTSQPVGKVLEEMVTVAFDGDKKATVVGIDRIELEDENSADPTSVSTAESSHTQGRLAAVAAAAIRGDVAQSVGISTAIGANPRRLTAEQEAVIADKSQVLVVEAGAGCGKTSTLVEKAKSMTGQGQYTAFNRSLVDESKQKLPGHVRCNTIHQLAFAVEGKRFAHRLNGRRIMSGELAGMLGLQGVRIEGPDGEPKTIHPAVLASHIRKTITNFCQSSDKEITLKHVPKFVGVDREFSTANADMLRQHILPYAWKMWEDKKNPGGGMPFQHDDYVKMWEMNDPTIGADFVMLDEAQDVSPVMLSIMEQQVRRGVRAILVGDSAQQIYSWRGAVNALASFPDAPRLMLSQSFRFGQVVAEVANAVLSHLYEPTPLVMKGFERIPSRLDQFDHGNAVLCRTNAGAISHLLNGIQAGKKPHLIGGGDDVAAWFRAAGDLQRGRTTSHPELCCFNNWNEVAAYSKTEEGEDLRLMVKIVKEFGVDKLLRALGGMPPEKEADFVISTAHRVKGREWNDVKLTSDFKPLAKMDDEECRLLYVAATRAKQKLDLESCPPFCGGGGDQEDDSNERTVNISRARELSDQMIGAEFTQEKKEEKALATAVPSKDEVNTWAKKDNQWVMRGKPGQTGQVEIVKRNGDKSMVTIKGVVYTDSEWTFYKV